MQDALAAGVDGIEHFSGLTSDGPRFDDDLLDEVARRGVYVDLTMGNDRSLHALMPAPPPTLAALMARLGVESFDEFYVSRIGVLGLLREHGVVVVTGVDSGMAPMKRHGNVWRTVPELVEAGYSPAAGPRGRDVGGRGGVPGGWEDRPVGRGLRRRRPRRGR